MVVKPHLSTERSHDEVQFSFHPQVKTRKTVKVNEPSYNNKLNQFLSSHEVKTIQKKPTPKVMKTSFVKKPLKTLFYFINQKMLSLEIFIGGKKLKTKY